MKKEKCRDDNMRKRLKMDGISKLLAMNCVIL